MSHETRAQAQVGTGKPYWGEKKESPSGPAAAQYAV